MNDAISDPQRHKSGSLQCRMGNDENLETNRDTPMIAILPNHQTGIKFVDYQDESQLDHVMSLVGRDLSEPYSSTYSSKCLFRF